MCCPHSLNERTYIIERTCMCLPKGFLYFYEQRSSIQQLHWDIRYKKREYRSVIDAVHSNGLVCDFTSISLSIHFEKLPIWCCTIGNTCCHLPTLCIVSVVFLTTVCLIPSNHKTPIYLCISTSTEYLSTRIRTT